MPKASRRKRLKRPAPATRRRHNGSSRGARASARRAAAQSMLPAESLRIDRGQRMLEVGSHMITYYMFLSHRLLPITGEPEVGVGPSNSPNRFAGQFDDVRRSLLRVVGHHPVLRGKIERIAEDADRLLADAGRYPAGHSARSLVQQEAKALSQRLRENSRAMSDLVAVLRNI